MAGPSGEIAASHQSVIPMGAYGDLRDLTAAERGQSSAGEIPPEKR